MGLNLFFERKKSYGYLRKARNSSCKKKGPIVFEVKPAVVVAVGGVVEIY